MILAMILYTSHAITFNFIRHTSDWAIRNSGVLLKS
jgi:hypothetical protein